MGGRHLNRRWSVAAVVGAVSAVVVGSWLVASASTGPSVVARQHPSALQASAPGSSGAAGAVAPSGTPGAVATTTEAPGGAPQPVSGTPPPGPAGTAAPPTVATTPAAPASPAPVAPAPVRRPVPRARVHGARAASSVAPSAPQYASAAGDLIGVLDQRLPAGFHVPPTPDNVALLARWMANEGGLWADNPLNTSLDASGYPHQYTTWGQDSGIPIFPSLPAGLAATATTLLSNPSYARILGVLQSGHGACSNFARAVILSPWASSHYGFDATRFCSGGIVPPHRSRGHGPRHR